jgi:peptidoglycan/xylan/chitin deacetylase (PgdA/CDA1 family)
VAVTFVPVRITAVGGHDEIAWAEGQTFTLPRALLDRIGWADRLTSAGTLDVPPGPCAIQPAEAAALRDRAAFTDAPPASARLPFSYQLVPGAVRALVASVVGRRQRARIARWAEFPRWPLDLTTDLLSDLAAVPRPDLGARTPVLITHDIDSPEGLRSLTVSFLPIEERAGARSTSYIVPCAWTPDDGAIDDIRGRGHEIGVHGYDHSNRTPFADEGERRRRLDAPRRFIERHGVIGYRAPSLLRTRPLLRGLASRYRYDSSIPTSGGLFPVPNNGCASARPFEIEGIREIPLTLPRDGSLRFLGYPPDDILAMWIACSEEIARSGGVVVLLTHCEARFSGNAAMLGVYSRFLEYVAGASGRFVFSSPREIVRRLEHVKAV